MMSRPPTRHDVGQRTTHAYGWIDDLKASIAQLLDHWPCAGLAVGVIADGELAWFHGPGLADVTAKIPITEETVFRIGSITKTFTAVAVMQLWEQGLVDLDAPANDYLRTCFAASSRKRPWESRRLAPSSTPRAPMSCGHTSSGHKISWSSGLSRSTTDTQRACTGFLHRRRAFRPTKDVDLAAASGGELAQLGRR